MTRARRDSAARTAGIRADIPTDIPRRALAFAGLAVVGALVLAGCTPSEPEPSESPSASPSASAEASPGITDVTDAPGSGEGFVGALADTPVETCEPADGGWRVAGTVTNPTEDPVDYRIYVSLLGADGADTRALTQVDVDGVEPATPTEWSTDIPLDEQGLACVLRVERYPAA